jgi:predicted Zn-dependent peptidase
VTASDIANGVFEGRMNFPKTKAEIVKYLKDNKDRLAVTSEVIDTVKNMLDKLYYNQADLIYGIEQGRR